MSALPYDTFPCGQGDTIKRWIENGIMPGSCFQAMLCNDLFATFANADPCTANNMLGMLAWLATHAPDDCYGSIIEVDIWHSHDGLFGMEAAGL